MSGQAITAGAGITVDTTADGDDGECSLDCTLREAIGTAASGEEIIVPPGIYSLRLGVVLMERNLVVSGTGARLTTIEVTTGDRAFEIVAGVEVVLSELTIRRNPPGEFGGGIQNRGVLTLDRCVLADSRSGLLPGGGGLGNLGDATLNGCLVTGNLAEFGGGIGNNGSLVLNNTTVSGNTSFLDGGGIVNFGGGAALNNSTVTANDAMLQGPGGIGIFAGTLTLRNSIVADQIAGGDCAGAIDSSPGFNLDSDGSCISGGGPGNLTASPLLTPLQDNGGPTDSSPPMPDSAAVDAGNPAAPGSGGDACLPADQRGVPRPQSAACDIGAVEITSNSACPDFDLDGICDVDDNCPQGFNPAQGPAVFGQTILASGPDAFSWPTPVDSEFIIGDLARVDILAVISSGSLLSANVLVDPVAPAPGSGLFYLVKPGGTCQVGSWQSTPGGEPDRDRLLP